jgi:hypothetical protein
MICIDIKTVIITAIFITVIIFFIHYFFTRDSFKPNNEQDDEKRGRYTPGYQVPYVSDPPINFNPQTVIDPVRQYDYQNLYDPLKDPKKRSPRDWYGISSPSNILGPVDLYGFPYIQNCSKSMPNIFNVPPFNFPTRGNSDTFSWVGYLVDKKSPGNDDNKILKLFGRQKYPRGYDYQYYTMIRNGGEEMKYDLNNKKELYNGDKVKVDILGRKYKVKLLKQQDFAYL